VLYWLRALLLGEASIMRRLDGLQADLNRLERNVATQADIDNLTAQIDANNQAIETGLQGIRQDLADLKLQNPGVDTSKLEASVAALTQTSADATELDDENPPAAPVDPPVDGQ
jgi:hypothetical protein